MFYYCNRPNTLYISNFDFSNVTSYSSIFISMKLNATIYVKKEIATLVLDNNTFWSISNVLLKIS